MKTNHKESNIVENHTIEINSDEQAEKLPTNSDVIHESSEEHLDIHGIWNSHEDLIAVSTNGNNNINFVLDSST